MGKTDTSDERDDVEDFAANNGANLYTPAEIPDKTDVDEDEPDIDEAI
jgi:hypothetical protein